MEQWDNFLKEQEKILGKGVVTKWLGSLKVLHFDACNLYLEAEDTFQINWFEEHFRPIVKSALLNNNHHPIKVHLTCREEKKSVKPKRKKGGQIDAFSFKIDPDPLLENSSFEQFIPGEKNQIAFQFLAGLKPGSFNPIFIYGPKGVGKTHLLMACAKDLLAKGIKAFYVHAETFTEHVVKAIRNSEMQEFRKIYRNQDILIIDDVDILSRKAATQEELFHTFNTFHTQGRQLIFSSSLSPSHLSEIEQRLVSRFEWGITFHIEKLSPLEMKQAVQTKLEKKGIHLKEELLLYLVALFPQGIKSLFQAVDLLCQNELPLTKESMESMLSDLIEIELETKLTPEKIVKQVAAYFGIKELDILGKSQVHEYSLPRQIAMHLCHSKLKMAYLRIGRFFSRDHSTVMFSIKQINKKRLDPETDLDRIFQELELKL